MGHRTGRRTVATLRRSPSAYEGFSLAATICLLVRRAASTYDGLSPRTTGRRKVATDRRSRRQTVARGEKPPYRCGGPPLLATVFPGLRRPVSGDGGPSYAEAERRSGRWGAVRLRWEGEESQKRGGVTGTPPKKSTRQWQGLAGAGGMGGRRLLRRRLRGRPRRGLLPPPERLEPEGGQLLVPDTVVLLEQGAHRGGQTLGVGGELPDLLRRGLLARLEVRVPLGDVHRLGEHPGQLDPEGLELGDLGDVRLQCDQQLLPVSYHSRIRRLSGHGPSP